MRISVEMKWGLVLLFVMVDEINDAIADPSTADWTKWLVLVNNRFWQDGAIEEIQTGKPGRDWMLLTPARFVTSFSRSVLVERRRRTFWSRSDRTRLLALRTYAKSITSFAKAVFRSRTEFNGNGQKTWSKAVHRSHSDSTVFEESSPSYHR